MRQSCHRALPVHNISARRAGAAGRVPFYLIWKERRCCSVKITYIHHSSFVVELEKSVLLFDYFTGKLPILPKEKELMVFASHAHGDHYSPAVFEAGKGRNDVKYILSRDIDEKTVPDGVSEKVRFVEPDEKFIVDNIRIETLRSTDEGVAFWISAENCEIYHAGDLNNWWWEGEDPQWNENMASAYRKEMQKLKGRIADAAFIPVDPRLGKWFYLGAEGFMREASAKAIFPMHFWEKYEIIESLKEHSSSEGWGDRIKTIHREGEEFVI